LIKNKNTLKINRKMPNFYLSNPQIKIKAPGTASGGPSTVRSPHMIEDTMEVRFF
jgi:hypothetical protein